MSADLLLLVSMAAVLSIEQQVEEKKQDLLAHNPWLRKNLWSIHDYVFCICTRCTTEPLMERNAMVAKRTAYAHRQADASKKLIGERDIVRANGSLTFVPYGDFFRMYREFVAGTADENGLACQAVSPQEQDQPVHDGCGDPEREAMDGVCWQCESSDLPDAPAMSPDAGAHARRPHSTLMSSKDALLLCCLDAA